MDSIQAHSVSGRQANAVSGSKVLIVFAVVFITGWLAGAAAGLAARQIGLLLNLGETAGHTLSWISITGARLILWLPATWIVFKRSLLDISFRSGRGWWIDLLHGIGVTALAMAVVFVAARQAGWLSVDGWMWAALPIGVFLGRLWVTTLIDACVVLGEEVIFRGFLLTGLVQGWGRWPGLILMMLIFGAVHLPAYSEQGYDPLVLTLALSMAAVVGLVLGLVFLRTGSLWLPIGIHFAWNFVETDLLNLAGDRAAENLVGALTRLQGPLAAGGAGLGNVVLDAAAFALLCLGLWLTLRSGGSSPGEHPLKTIDAPGQS